MRPPRSAEWSLLFAAVCLPTPRPAMPDPLLKPLPVTSQDWEPVGEATALKVSSEIPFGQVLAAGPWLGDGGESRVELRSKTRFGFVTGSIQGSYRTEGLYPYGTVVTASFYKGERWLGDQDFHLEPSPAWRAFELPVRFAPPGADGVRVGFGVAQKGGGRAFFASPAYVRNPGTPLVECTATPAVLRPAPPSALEATGYIHLRLTDSGWWFVAPDGRGAFSTGLGRTMTELPGRSPGLPSRIAAWGFNSLADSSNYPAWHLLNMSDPAHALWVFHVYSGMPADPYDPQFAESYRARVRQATQYLRGAPWVAGSYAEDELDPALFRQAIWSGHAGQALGHFLLVRYGSIAILNHEWGTSFASFEELVKAQPRPTVTQGKMASDLAAFTRELVLRYVSLTARIIREEDPEHLVFSPRLVLGPGVLSALPYLDLLAAYDAVGVKLAPESVFAGLSGGERSMLALISQASQRPLVVSGFSVAARDSGLYDTAAGLDRSFWRSVGTQAARAQQTSHALIDLYNLPFVVGAHWESLRDLDDGSRRANAGLLQSPGAAEYPLLQAALAGFNRRVRMADPKLPAAPAPVVQAPSPLVNRVQVPGDTFVISGVGK